MVKYVRFFLIAIIAFGFVSCEEHITESRSTDTPPSQGKQVPSIIQEGIFNKSCALSGCHEANKEKPNLTADVAYGNIVNVSSFQKSDLKRIEPGDPNRSYLYLKIIGSSEIVGSRMPLDKPPLSDTEIGAIRSWIEIGAPSE